MATRCFRLALSCNNDHSEAYNNLGVLEWRRGRGEQVCGVYVCVEWPRRADGIPCHGTTVLVVVSSRASLGPIVFTAIRPNVLQPQHSVCGLSIKDSIEDSI